MSGDDSAGGIRRGGVLSLLAFLDALAPAALDVLAVASLPDPDPTPLSTVEPLAACFGRPALSKLSARTADTAGAGDVFSAAAGGSSWWEGAGLADGWPDGWPDGWADGWDNGCVGCLGLGAGI